MSNQSQKSSDAPFKKSKDPAELDLKKRRQSKVYIDQKEEMEYL